MKLGFKIIQILSIILLICSVLVPMFDTWVGIIPTDDAWSISDTFETLADEGTDALNYYGVQLHLCTWILGSVVCMGAFMKKKAVIATSAIAGAISLILVVVNNMNQYGDSFHYLMNFEDGNYSIGYWIALILFILCAVISFFCTKEPANTSTEGEEGNINA